MDLEELVWEVGILVEEELELVRSCEGAEGVCWVDGTRRRQACARRLRLARGLACRFGLFFRRVWRMILLVGFATWDRAAGIVVSIRS